jgi:CheY-like chemotaxis protein
MLDRILCIDDDPITLMLCKKVIVKTMFSNEIITAQNGEKALQYFDDLQNIDLSTIELPKLIFLDLNMPVMGGWEFLDAFNAPGYHKFHNIKVVVLTSTIDPEDLEKSQTYPMVLDFLSKPITVSMLEYISAKFNLSCDS